MKISEHFTKEELSCRCCGLFLSTVDFVVFLEKVRKMYGQPMNISRGTSCAKHNADPKVGGASTSAHLIGLAVDVDIESDANRAALVEAALSCGATGIGIYQNHVHIDKKARKRRVLWYGSYKKATK